MVLTFKAVALGASQVSGIGDGFAFIDEKETADVHGKFACGVAV
jgi:hypothetical protein